MIKLPVFSKNLWLRSGDWVEVKSAEEILATLDDNGRLHALPFMPEMLQHCGKRFRVHKSAHKTCDTIGGTHKIRRMMNAVHLEGLRCDGTAHGGCQARCLLFWKKAWLKPVRGPELRGEADGETKLTGREINLDALNRVTRAMVVKEDQVEERYSCQATELFQATTPLKWWAPGPYVMDLLSDNVRLRDFVRYTAIAAFNIVMRLNRFLRPLGSVPGIWRLNGFFRQYPSIRGLAEGKTPTKTLNLKPGEFVQVRSKKEIMRTINGRQRNRGLWFDVEMVPYCDKTFQIIERVDRIIDEKTGKMMTLPDSCLVLDRVTCRGIFSRDRLFCPRNTYAYWREIWLKRIQEADNRSDVLGPDPGT